MSTATSTIHETDVRMFAATYPTPNTLRALALCESGRLAWDDVAALFARSLRDAMVSA